MQPETFFHDIAASENTPAHRIAYYSWGNSAAEQTIICVHGLTRNGRDFDFFASALSDKYRIICPDMPGRGESDYLANPAAYNSATYLVDILSLLTALKITKTHWIGTSMGGIIGMIMANTIPGLIRSLTLNDVGMLIPAAALKRIMSYAGVNTNFATRAEAEAALRANCSPFGIKSEINWQHIFTYGIVEDNGKFRLNYDPKIMIAFANPEKVEDANMWGLLEGVSKIPTLLIRGADSDLLTRDTALQMKEKIPGLTLYEVAGAGHAPALMEDDQISFIKNWLAAN